MAMRTFALSALVAAGLAACASYEAPVTPAPVMTAPPVVAATPPAAPSSSPAALTTLQPGTYRPGSGILESIGLVTLPASAAAGATAAAPAPGPFRLTLRMDDGSVQTVIQDTRALLVGDRLQITPDGKLLRP
jgi:hypothetical protein